MELTGEEIVPGSQEDVWKALTDPDVLRRCIPGCASLVQEDERSYALEVVFKIGPAEPRFSGKMTIEEPDYPNSYELKAFGQDRSASDAIGQAYLVLQEDAGQDTRSTRLGYRMLIGMRGNLARLGEKLIFLVARRMTETFFRRFQEINRRTEPAASDPAADEEIQAMIDQALRGENWQS